MRKPSNATLLVEYHQKGNQNAREQLILKNIHVVENNIKRFFKVPAQEYEDVRADGILLLEKAIDSYKTENAFSFSTHIIKRIIVGLKRLYPEYLIVDPVAKRKEEIIRDESDEGEWEDQLIDEIELKEQMELVYAAFARMDSKDRSILELKIGLVDKKEWSLRELSDKFGLTKEGVRYRIEKSLKILKGHMCDIMSERKKQRSVDVKTQDKLQTEEKEKQPSKRQDREKELSEEIARRNRIRRYRAISETLKKYNREGDVQARERLIKEHNKIVGEIVNSKIGLEGSVYSKAVTAGLETIEKIIDEKKTTNSYMIETLLYSAVYKVVNQVIEEEREKENKVIS